MPVFGEAEYPEEIRLKYRFLDLRREKLHGNIMKRGQIVDSIRSGPLVAAADRLVERVQARMRGSDKSDQPCKPDDLTVVLFRPHRPRC